MCIAFVVLFIVSLYCFGTDVSEYYKTEKGYEKIKNKAKTGKSIDWKALWNINKDIVAWIEIPDTKIDYPVVQAKSNSEYLYKNVEGNYSMYGAIFLDERLYGTSLKANPNNIIYGHNMGRWTNVMFGSLREYLDENYLEKHRDVILYTPQKTYKYGIASVMYGTSSSSVYETEFDNVLFTEWIKEQMNKSLYPCLDNHVINSYISKFSEKNLKKRVKKYGNTLTLSTCDTTHNTGKKICIFCIPETN